MFLSVPRLQELTVCSEDNVDVHDIELMQYINVDCSKLKRLLQGQLLIMSQTYTIIIIILNRCLVVVQLHVTGLQTLQMSTSDCLTCIKRKS